MTDHHDEDGDSIVLTDEDREYIQGEIAAIDAQLRGAKGLAVIRELGQRWRHLADELQAGHWLQLSDASEHYDYEIVPREAELGGGWRLYLIEDGKEVGGGVFPVVMDEVAGILWWNGMSEADRTRWLARARLPSAAEAYLAHMADEAWHGAAQAAGEWLDSRPQAEKGN